MSAGSAVTHTILIVDRDPEALAFNVRILSGAGYRVVVATSFEEASSRLLASKPDVLIADIRLDAYNGLHLVFRARDEFPHIVALVTDSWLDPVLQADAAALGVVYLVKPLDADTLLPVLETRLRDRPDTPPLNFRRWPRKRTGHPYSAVVGTRQAKVVEISYGGLRLETALSQSFSRHDQRRLSRFKLQFRGCRELRHARSEAAG